jgi:hypothetical protein
MTEGVHIPLYVPEQSKEMMDEALDSATPSDKAFLRKLADGYRWQVYVMSALQSYGYWAQVHPLRVRPSAEKHADYSDSFDIKIGSGPSYLEPWERSIDVKARTRTFDGPETFPFDTVIIEPTARFNRRDLHPDCWCMVSQYNAAMIFIPSDNHEEWATEYKKGISYKTAPREEFLSLEQYIGTLPESPLLS